MVKRIVPASADNSASRHTQDRLIPQIEIIAIMPIVTIDPTGTRPDSHIGPFRAIVAHKNAIVDIPGLVVIDKGGGALPNRSASIEWPVHELRRHGILSLNMRADRHLCVAGSRVTENRRSTNGSNRRYKQDS